VPLPQGSLDLKAQTYHSRTRPSPRLDKGGASRESTRAWSLSELCSRRHSPPSSLKRNAAAAQRRPALVPPYRRRAGTQATQTTQAAAPSARSRFQSARWSTPRCVGEVGTASHGHKALHMSKRSTRANTAVVISSKYKPSIEDQCRRAKPRASRGPCLTIAVLG
jgi:hypothetical protein